MGIMDSPEFLIVAMDVVIVSIAYGLVYPQIAGNQLKKISAYDSIITLFLLTLVGSQYWGTGHEFDLLVTKVNWFLFTFWSFSAIEIPVMLWYFKKHGVDIYSDKQ